MPQDAQSRSKGLPGAYALVHVPEGETEISIVARLKIILTVIRS